jgi:hypothetical protein
MIFQQQATIRDAAGIKDSKVMAEEVRVVEGGGK